MFSWQFLPQINITSLFTGGTFAIVLVTLIRVWPIVALQIQKAKEKLREEGRSDLNDCKARLDEMTRTMTGFYDLVTNLKIEMHGVLSAYRVLEVAEEQRDPLSIHLAQARAILSTAFTIAPSTIEPVHKSDTLRAAEETCIAADLTKAKIKQNERDQAEGDDK